jgi:lysophospholipase L1-like esterase
MKNITVFIMMLVSLESISLSKISATFVGDATKKWVGTWSTAPQLVELSNMPPSPGLTNNSLRQVVRVSLGGDTLRVKFSNEFSTSSVTMNSVQIAVSTGGNTINVSTNKELKFNGSSKVNMNAGVAVTSDPIAFKLTPRMDLAITIYFGQTSTTVTGHPGSRTTSYILAGNTTATTDFTGAVTTEHWYNIDAIDVLVPSTAACIAILGNSITDGRGSTTNMQNRWPDIFSEALLKDSSTQQTGVLNLGIGGNCVLTGGLGPTGVSRYDRDILNQQGVRWAIVFEGVNDIGGVRSVTAATTTANNLITAYKQMIAKAHAKNIRIYGATITPFKGNSYYNQYSELCRNTVNQWIRTVGNYDACIDFDKTMRNPLDTLSLVSTYQNDGLHPDAARYITMGQSIDLNLFTISDTVSQQTTGANSIKAIDGYILGQNYPNPFNPSTNISFNIPSRSFVSLTVFDLLGKKVATIVSEEMSAGTYSREWNARSLVSEVYFYHLEAGSFIETKKLVLYLDNGPAHRRAAFRPVGGQLQLRAQTMAHT